MDSIAFILPEVKLGACGVSDYALRMATTLAGLGIRCSLLSTEPIEPSRTSAGVSIGPADAEEALGYELICIQYVPNLKPEGRRFFSQMAGLRHPKVHLMVHEFFRISSKEHPLGIRGRIKSRFQLFQLRSLIRKTRPHTISTSNDHYRKTLSEYGINASVSPMPGTIPIEAEGHEPVELGAAEWFRRKKGEFIWVVFGNLYTNFWDCAAYFREISRLGESTAESHRWVICGKQADGEESRFRATASGFADSVIFTGPVPAASVDWLMRNADASLSGTGGDFWQKSTGVLVALERGLPIYFPREKLLSRDFGEPTLYHDLGQLVRDRIRSNGCPPPYQGPHSPRLAAERLLEIVASISSL